MVRLKGKTNKTNKYWSKEENINPGQLNSWMKKYIEKGEQDLINVKKPGSQYKGLKLK